MIIKKAICQARLRRIPSQFSWVDHRLIRNGYISNCDSSALALYLLLVTVGDANGLSYYSDASIRSLLSFSAESLISARAQLMRTSLIAYQKPIYQVLSLDVNETADQLCHDTSKRTGAPVSIDHVISNIIGGGK